MENNTTISDVIVALKEIFSCREAVSLEQLVMKSKYGREDVIEALNAMANEELIEQEKTNHYRLK